VLETVEWLRPDLRRIFTASHRIADLEGTKPSDDAWAGIASDYINYVWFTENPGERIIDDFIFDGLLQRNGWIGVDWKQPTYGEYQEIKGLNTLQFQGLSEDQNTIVEKVETEDVPPSEGYPDGIMVNCCVRQVKAQGSGELFSIAPEDMRVSGKAANDVDLPYIGDIVRMMRGEAKGIWKEHEDAIDNAESQIHSSSFASERRAQRFQNQVTGVDQYGEGDNELIEILREFIRFDLDGDGYPEWVKCWRIDDTLLEAKSVDDHIYSTWSPITIPHRLHGLSIYDITKDIQDIETSLTRAVLNSIAQNINPRLLVNEETIDIDDMLVQSAGAIIPTRGHFQLHHLTPVPSNDMSKLGFEGLERMDQLLEVRTGISRFNQFEPQDSHRG
jgi:hypothetical protein